MNKETLKKYGVWIVAGALVLYLVYKSKGGSVTPRLLPSASGGSDASLELERMRQAGALDLKRLELNNNLEAIRLKAANDQYNLQQQALARQRALDAAQRGQTLGLIGQIANSIAGLFKSATGTSPKTAPPPSGGSSGGGNARTQPQPPPFYQVPAPNIPGLLNPPYTPDYPVISDYPLSVTDWGEAPQFSSAQMDLDTGASFFDQSWGGDDFYYGYGSDYQGDLYSGLPDVGGTYDPYSSGGNIGVDDFYYGYGGESYDYAYGGGGGDVYVQSVGDEGLYGWGGDE